MFRSEGNKIIQPVEKICDRFYIVKVYEVELLTAIQQILILSEASFSSGGLIVQGPL